MGLQATRARQWSKHQGAAQSLRDPTEDVLLGPLLGQGTHGSVYLAKWNAATIAVKVRLDSRALLVAASYLRNAPSNVKHSKSGCSQVLMNALRL